MSLPRLSLLHSSLLKSALLSEPSFQRASSQTSIACRVRERIRTPQRRFQSTNFERYGPAKDLLPPPQKPDSKPLNTREDGDSQQQPRASDEGNVAKKDAGSEPERLDTTKASKEEAEITKSDAGEAHPPEKVEGPQLEAPDHPLEKVLQMPAPTSADKAKPPHLETPPYVHHFDTYTLVKDLGKGGFTQDQSITVMKAVRSLLAANLELAREGLVSKSDVENESYLFRAACSELRTEVQNSRKTAADKMRSERAHLQHEVEILNQRVTQESANLKDELKGWFDDRKMAVRMEQRSMESEIQELNYKITVAMSGDSRGEVEGLRWFLTRRAAILIASMAILILGTLRYASYMAHTQEQERKKMAKLTNESEGSGSVFTIPSRSTGTQTEKGQTDAMLAGLATDKGTDAGAGYVSLG